MISFVWYTQFRKGGVLTPDTRNAYSSFVEIKLVLNRFLSDHNLTRYRLAATVKGQLSQSAVYALTQSDQVQRIDLGTLAVVLSGLRELTGEKVHLQDILEEVEDDAISPLLAELVCETVPLDWERAGAYAESFTDRELVEDEKEWAQYRDQQRRGQEFRYE